MLLSQRGGSGTPACALLSLFVLTRNVSHSRPVGAPSFTYARGLHKALAKVGIDRAEWHEKAQDRESWYAAIKYEC